MSKKRGRQGEKNRKIVNMSKKRGPFDQNSQKISL